MKARIFKKDIKDLTEEKVQAAIDSGCDIVTFLRDYGVDLDAMIARCVKLFGKEKSTKFFNALMDNTPESKIADVPGCPPSRVLSAPFANPEILNASTKVTVRLRCREDPSKNITVSQLFGGRDFASLPRREKIDCITELLTERVSEQLMEQYKSDPNEFDLSAMDETFARAVLSRVHEQEFRRELQEVFDLEDGILAEIELQYKNKMSEREMIASKINSLSIELRRLETEYATLESRIERCRENHDWRLPQRISELNRKATEALNRLDACSGKNRANQEKKYNSLLAEIETCEGEVEAAAGKLLRLQRDLDALGFKMETLRVVKAELQTKRNELDCELNTLEAQKKELLKARFYLKMSEEGVIVTTRNVQNDLVSDDLRPMTDTEIAGTVDWTDRLRDYEKDTGTELEDNDFVTLVRILFLAPKQKQGYEIIYGEGTEYLAKVIEYFFGGRK